MQETVPQIIDTTTNLPQLFPCLDEKEILYVNEARGLFNDGYFSYSLLGIWNAAINNLKRRVEAYSVELWCSVVKDEPGRKKYNKNGDTIAQRWEDVDDITLIAGVTKLGLLNPKACRSLEMINWMRNHASPAHDSDNRVEKEDVVALVLLLQKNLFSAPIPEAAHAVKEIFAPVKDKVMGEQELTVLRDQILSSSNKDVNTIFGFLLSMIVEGEEPSSNNARALFPTVWTKADTDLRKSLGVRCNNYLLDPASDTSSDSGARTRVLELLVAVQGVSYIPDGARARLFRRAAEKLHKAKNTSYGWASEVAASKMLNQLGTSVPSVAFEEVYQEILSVWCGNMWGHSDSIDSLRPFIDCLNSDQIRKVASMFIHNQRVTEELYWAKPKARAMQLLLELQSRLTLEAHIEEINLIIKHLKNQ